MVESQPSKLLVAGSIPVSRSNLRSLMQAKVVRHRSKSEGGLLVFANELRLASRPSRVRWPTCRRSRKAQRCGARAPRAKADVAQLAERVLGKDEVTSSILVIGSILRSRPKLCAASYGWQAILRDGREIRELLSTEARRAKVERVASQLSRAREALVHRSREAAKVEATVG